MKKDNQIQVSYLVASYNHSKYIERCLDSILQDSAGLTYELIILDDGSSDLSIGIIEGWIQRKSGGGDIRLIARPNKGVSATLNELVDNSRGEFVRLVASDDMLVTGSTGQMIDVLKKNLNSIAVVGDVTVVDQNDNIIAQSRINQLGRSFLNVYTRDLKRAIIECWAICGPAAVFRREYRDIVGKYDERLLIEDWSMFLRLSSINKLTFTPKAVALYRIHGENTSLTRDNSKRVRNLRSQLVAGRDGKVLYKGFYGILLVSQIYLIEAKIGYLTKRYERAVFFTMSYILMKVIARMGLALRNKIE